MKPSRIKSNPPSAARRESLDKYNNRVKKKKI